MLKEKKTLHEKELSPYLIVSMMVEMMLDGNLEITDKNKVVLTDRIPTADYNLKLYDIIKNMKKDEVSLRVVLSSVCYSFSAKKLKEIINTLKNEMVQHNLITLETKKGLIARKK